MIFSGSGSLPHHQYVWVDKTFIRRDAGGFEPAVWFGVYAHPGRMWGCHLMLECGAVYRGVPPHALAFAANPDPCWTEKDAQLWDCYGRNFSLHRYTYLTGLQCLAKIPGRQVKADYLFTAIPLEDGFSEAPDQSKEFMFVRTAGERLCILPTNKMLFLDSSFTTKPNWPTDLKTMEQTFSCEEWVLD